MSEEHFFATCIFGWAKAASRDEAITKVANRFRDDIKACIVNLHRNGQPGFYVWTCKVLTSIDTPYDLENYHPVAVKWRDSINHYVTRIERGKDRIFYYTEER